MSTHAAHTDERDLELLESIATIEGWLAPDEARLLAHLASLVPRTHAVVEIGNYRGRSTVALALGAARGLGAQVYSIDPHVEFRGPRGGRFGREDQAHLYSNLARAGVGAHVSVVGLDSRAVAPGWNAGPVGLLFVDGDHRYAAARADYEAWERHLAPSTVVAFDDCDFPDIARLLDELERAGCLLPRGCVGKVRWFEHASRGAQTVRGDGRG